MQKKVIIFFIILMGFNVNSQNKSIYHWNWNVDGPWLATSLIGSGIGLSLVINKDKITESKLQSIVRKQDEINPLDRWIAGNYSPNASYISDGPFYLAFVAPIALLLDDEVNENAGIYSGMFLESMATTGAMYGLTAGLLNRSRPYVYSERTPMDRRLGSSGQRSFFSGHTAMTATASFFVAKVYTDYNQDSPGLPYIWAGAISLPLAVAYLRIDSGQHFLTDVVVGYTIGALVGYFTPELHKKKYQSFTVRPTTGVDFFGDNYQAISFKLKF